MKKKNVMVSLSVETIEKVKRMAKIDNRSMSGLIESLIIIAADNLTIDWGDGTITGDIKNLPKGPDLTGWVLPPTNKKLLERNKSLKIDSNNPFSGNLNLTPEEIFNFKILAVKLWNEPSFRLYMWGYTQEKIDELIKEIEFVNDCRRAGNLSVWSMLPKNIKLD